MKWDTSVTLGDYVVGLVITACLVVLIIAIDVLCDQLRQRSK